MKPAKKPFAVEIRNRRHASRKPTSIWGNIDLKAASGQAANFDPVDRDDANADTGFTDADRKHD